MRVVLLVMLLADAPAPADNLEDQAANGDNEALHKLCYSYLYGAYEREQNLAEAAKWCERAADAGVASSQTLLAEMYRFGYHFEKDDETAKRWYRKAADQGHVHAEFMLGRIALTSPDPGQEDLVDTCYWLRRAAEKGYEKARQTLDLVESTWAEERGSGKPGFCDRVLGQPAE